LRKAHLAGWTVGWRTAFERAGQEYIRAQSWYPRGGAPQFTGDRPGRGCELIATFHPKGRKKWNGGGHHGFYDFPIVLNRGKKTERLHTAQKPLELMRELVRRFSNPGEVVLDAFAGSGTTGHACLLEGRSFLGIEKQEKYVEVARARLSNVVVERGADAISVGG
jgi:site-specific DNA-methyltransferase (adenine-specific)